MKKFLLMMLMAVSCLNMNAQNTRHDSGTFTLQPMLGVTAGAMGGKLTYYVEDDQQKTNIDDLMRIGFVGGLELEGYINSWMSASVGAAFTMQGWRIKEKISEEKWNVNLNYINVPVLANFYVLDGLAIKVGIQPGFLLSATQDGDDVKDALEKLNLSIPIGISYEFEDFVTLDLRATYGLTTINKNHDSDNKFRSNALWLTVGYKFEL